MSAETVGLTICFFVILLIVWSLRENTSSTLPPGPRAWPVIGNSWDLLCLSKNSANWCQLFAETYGDLTTFTIGRVPVVLINQPDAAHDLLQKHASLSSDRPMANSFRYDNLPDRIIVGPADEKFCRIRKTYKSFLSSEKSAMWQVHQEYESWQLLRSLVQRPGQFLLACDRYTTNIMSSVIYSHRFVEGFDDEVVCRLYRIWEAMYLYFLPWTLPSDFFPSLLRLPKFLQPWHCLLTNIKQSESEIQQTLLRQALNSPHKEHGRPSLAIDLLSDYQKPREALESTSHILSMLHGAGSDTVSGSMQIFFKVIAMHPAVMKAASKEIDEVVGPARLPCLQDRARLPYIQAMIKEMHRWAPLANIGVPHALGRDLEYRGYHFPKGTILVPNILTLSHHPDRYFNPTIFDPMRFYGHPHSGSETSAVRSSSQHQQRDHFVYGFGRRFCPGSHVADATLFIGISRVLWAFDIDAPAGGSRLSLEDQRDGLLGKPRPFEVLIKPRRENLADVLNHVQIYSTTLDPLV